MQGVMLFFGSMARIFGPAVVAISFAKWGPTVTWLGEIAVLVFTIILWLIFYKRMVPLKTELDPGTSHKYKNGVKYRL